MDLDVRTLYLKDLTFFGCTFQEDVVFENLVSYIESGEIRPLLSKTYPLDRITDAQKDFIAKKYPGKLALIPPQPDRTGPDMRGAPARCRGAGAVSSRLSRR